MPTKLLTDKSTKCATYWCPDNTAQPPSQWATINATIFISVVSAKCQPYWPADYSTFGQSDVPAECTAKWKPNNAALSSTFCATHHATDDTAHKFTHDAAKRPTQW